MDFNDIVGKAKDLAAENADQARGVIDQAGDFVDEKTGGQFSDQINQGREFVSDQLGVAGEQGQEVAQDASNEGQENL